MDSLTNAAPHTLDYAPPPPWHRRRWRRMALVALVIFFIGSMWRWGAFVYARVSVLCWQHQCMTFAQPGDQVVYDEGPNAGALLTQRGYLRYSKTPAPMGNRYKVKTLQSRRHPPGEPPVILMADCWRHFSDDVPCWPWADGSTLLSHEMISKAGVHRLVVIQHTPGIEDGLFILGIDLDEAVFVPGTLHDMPRPVPRGYNFSGHLSQSTTPQNLRIYAGQVDANDPSHFTIRYEQWGQTDILDGWLRDDGIGVHVAPRNRPIAPQK